MTDDKVGMMADGGVGPADGAGVRVGGRIDAELAAAVLARVVRGESLRSICRDTGVPVRPVLRAWAQADAGFGAALISAQRGARAERAARRRCQRAAGLDPDAGPDCGPGPGLSLYTEEAAIVVCRWVAQGKSLRWVARQPGMPHRTTLRNWANSRPEFCRRLLAAMRVARLEARRRDRALAAAKAARPKPVKGGRESSYTPELGEAICDRIANGESVVSIGADPAMPCAGTIYAWAKRHRDFDAMYTQARELQGHYLFDEAREVALAATPSTVWVGRLQFDVIRWQAAKLAPKKYADRILAWQLEAEAKAAGTVRRIYVVNFITAPDGHTVLATPPRNEAEELEYERHFGKRYDGARYQVVEDD